jgi:hypothetical protein|tara:strand:+ start:1276 stop:1461 length:186 start_codon:yes stop_codon:yes gene_type:complete
MEETNTIIPKFTTMYIPKKLKNELNDYKIHERETYGDAIKRLIKYRNFDIINGQIITREML